jgi:hypothetical protein
MALWVLANHEFNYSLDFLEAALQGKQNPLHVLRAGLARQAISESKGPLRSACLEAAALDPDGDAICRTAALINARGTCA